MSDLQKVLSEAQKAQEEAEAAVRRANELAGQADIVREQAAREADKRRREWAQQLVDTYDTEIAAADVGIQEAQARFDAAAVGDLSAAVAAYVGWGEASMRHYGLQIRISAAADILGHDATPAQLVQIPPFSKALDAALGEAVAKRAEVARAEAAAELDRLRGNPA